MNTQINSSTTQTTPQGSAPHPGAQRGCWKNQTPQPKTFWQTVKHSMAKGLGLGFGGALGWRLGNFVADLISAGWRLILMALAPVIFVHGVNWLYHKDDPQLPAKPPVVQQQHQQHR